MGTKRMRLGEKLSLSKPGKPSPGHEVQEATSGIGLMILCIGIGSLFLFGALKGCSDEMKKSQASARVTTQSFR